MGGANVTISCTESAWYGSGCVVPKSWAGGTGGDGRGTDLAGLGVRLTSAGVRSAARRGEGNNNGVKNRVYFNSTAGVYEAAGRGKKTRPPVVPTSNAAERGLMAPSLWPAFRGTRAAGGPLLQHEDFLCFNRRGKTSILEGVAPQSGAV